MKSELQTRTGSELKFGSKLQAARDLFSAYDKGLRNHRMLPFISSPFRRLFFPANLSLFFLPPSSSLSSHSLVVNLFLLLLHSLSLFFHPFFSLPFPPFLFLSSVVLN